MNFGSFPTTQITVTRGSEKWEFEGLISGKQIDAEAGTKVKRGDTLLWPGISEPYVVDDVEYAGAGITIPAHETIKIIAESRWKERSEGRGGVVQHIGTAHNVAGRDVHETTNHITYVQVLQSLEKRVKEDMSIPEKEKTTLLQKIQSVINSPYVSGIATGAMVEAAKMLLTH